MSGIPSGVRARAEELRKQIGQANYAYYAEDAPVLSDSEYDRLLESELIKQELKIIRERVVEKLGYDTFREDVIVQRGKEILHTLLSEDVQVRRERLLDVAFQMLQLQEVIPAGNEKEAKALRRQLEKIYDEGWLQGYMQACNLFYVRR